MWLWRWLLKHKNAIFEALRRYTVWVANPFTALMNRVALPISHVRAGPDNHSARSRARSGNAPLPLRVMRSALSVPPAFWRPLLRSPILRALIADRDLCFYAPAS